MNVTGMKVLPARVFIVPILVRFPNTLFSYRKIEIVLIALEDSFLLEWPTSYLHIIDSFFFLLHWPLPHGYV